MVSLRALLKDFSVPIVYQWPAKLDFFSQPRMYADDSLTFATADLRLSLTFFNDWFK